MLKTILAASIATLLVAAPAMAETPFQKAHPRRAEVNHRERVQTHAINKAKRDGDITQAEARDLHKQDLSIKKDERADVKANGGYLTKDQTKDLNKDLTDTRKDLHADRAN
jgi:hypothetical protein